MLDAIFERQEQLSREYRMIEIKSGLGLGLVRNKTFDLDNRWWQYVIKDYFWRIAEELAESAEAGREGTQNHAREEAIDALHFIVEVMIHVNWKPDQWRLQELEGYDKLKAIYECVGSSRFENSFEVIYHLGLAANCLKLKPWKRSPVATDQRAFYRHLEEAFLALIGYCRQTLRMTAVEIYGYYFRKSDVNEFRQRSKY